MTALQNRCAYLTCIAAVLALAGCGSMGKVEQGRVIAYDSENKRITLIREASPPGSPGPGVLPPVTIAAPADPREMGPAPAAGGVMLLDSRHCRLVIYDRATQSFRTILYTPLDERRNIAKSPGHPVVDRTRKTITVYAAAERKLITFAASDELLAMPADTWRAGDVVRYYYKVPAQALRMMNVTQTDLSKSG